MKNYWLQFMKRYNSELHLSKRYCVVLDGTESSYENINQIDNMVYEHMVAAGIAKYLPALYHAYLSVCGNYWDIRLSLVTKYIYMVSTGILVCPWYIVVGTH